MWKKKEVKLVSGKGAIRQSYLRIPLPAVRNLRDISRVHINLRITTVQSTACCSLHASSMFEKQVPLSYNR